MEEGHWRCDLIGQTEEASGKPQVVRAVLQVQQLEPLEQEAHHHKCPAGLSSLADSKTTHQPTNCP